MVIRLGCFSNHTAIIARCAMMAAKFYKISLLLLSGSRLVFFSPNKLGSELKL